MIDEFAVLGQEYDELLMKPDKSIDDIHRIGQIEDIVMSRFGFCLAMDCLVDDMEAE